ncbi:tyrosine-type recombinase/integrase [Peteryoungia desertarenae]|nr:site-specific integrase [Peteryoungia desertarenae]
MVATRWRQDRKRMPTIKLTRKEIAKLDMAPKTAITYFDDDVKGLGLRIMPSGVATFIFEYRPGAGGRGVSKKRLKIGRLDSMTPEAARAAAKSLRASVHLGADPAGDKAEVRAAMTFGELADEFLSRHVAKKCKGSTGDYYRYIVNTHLKPALGKSTAAFVKFAEVAKMHDDIAIGKATGRGGKYVANRAVAILSSLYSWADKNGLVPKGTNPATGIDLYKEQQRDRFLTGDELERLGNALALAETCGIPYEVDESKAKSKHARKPENRRMKFPPHVTGAIRLLLLTGCRLREILHLEWKHVDLERGFLFLPDSKTGRKAVILSRPAIEVIEQIPRHGRYVIASDSAGTPDEKPRADLKRPWATIAGYAGLDGVRIHDLRHTFASIGAGSGLGLPVIGNLLGHSNAKTTQRYSHIANDPARRAADLISDHITTAMGVKNGEN